MDLATLMQQAAVLNNTQTQQGNQIAGLQTEASNTAMQSSELLKGVATGVYETELTQLQFQLETEQDRVKVAQAFGTDVGAQSDVLTPLAEVMRSTSIAYLQSQERVSEIEAGSDLLGNPIGWLKDLVVGDGARAERDALAKKLDSQAKVAQTLNISTQQSVATQNAIMQTVNASSIEHIAKTKSAIATVKANEEHLKALGYGADAIGTMMQVGASNFNRNLQMYNEAESAKRWAIQQEELSAARAERKDKKQMMVDTMENINAFRAAFGGGPPVDAAYVTKFYDSPRLGPELQDQDQMGWRLRATGKTEGLFGADAASAYTKMQVHGVNPPPAWTPAMELFAAADRKLNEELTKVGTTDKNGLDYKSPYGLNKDNKKDPRVIQSTFNTVVRELADVNRQVIRPGTGNIFELPSITTIESSPSPAVAKMMQSTFGQKVLGNLKITGNDAPPMGLVVEQGLAAVERGELSMTDLNRGLGTYIDEGLGIKQASMGLHVLNIPGSASYNVSAEDLTGMKRRDPQGFLGSTWSSLVNNTVGIPARMLSNDTRKQFTAPKEIWDMAKPEERMTVLQIIASRRKAAELLGETKENTQ